MNEKDFFIIENKIKNANSIECSNGQTIISGCVEKIEFTVGEPLTFRVNDDGSSGGIPEKTWIFPRFVFGYHDDYNIHIEKICGDSAPMWELFIENTNSAKNISILSTANVTVGDGEPPKILGGDD